MRLSLNKDFIIDVSIHDGKYIVNGAPLNCSIHKIGDNMYRLILNNKVFHGVILSKDNQVSIQIGHKIFDIETENEHEFLQRKIGITPKIAKKTASLKAPMPGMIVEVLVQTGETVKIGQPLLVLKAMKMENIIKSPENGKITALFIEKGMTVEKDAQMIQF